jgi:hypothetical protein
MKVIIAGSRSIADYPQVCSCINMSRFSILEVVSGGARGVDKLGEAWAKEHSIPIKAFPADWNHQGRAAGIVRNQEMAAYADALIAIWDGESRGTKHMIEYMRDKMMKSVEVWVYNKHTRKVTRRSTNGHDEGSLRG